LVRTTSQVETLRAAGMRLLYGDVTDRESLSAAVAGQEIVYHLAGCTKAVDWRCFYRVNQRGVANIAQACAERASPPTLIVTSSLAAAGPATNGHPRTETDRPTPVSHYGHSKRAGERAAEAFAHRLPITIVRPPIVLGEGDRMGLPLFRSINRFRVHMVPGQAQRRFSVIHADDLAHLLILAAERGSRLPPHRNEGARGPEGYYFASAEEDPVYADLGRMVAEAMGRHLLVVIPAAGPVVWTVAYAGEAVSRIRHDALFMNVDKAREITAGSWVCSAERAAAELGFRVAAALPQRLRQTADWYRREGWL
jgi:nucleoside-diphosphate-sugar epimerase